jgi:hypothetical protein
LFSRRVGEAVVIVRRVIKAARLGGACCLEVARDTRDGRMRSCAQQADDGSTNERAKTILLCSKHASQAEVLRNKRPTFRSLR